MYLSRPQIKALGYETFARVAGLLNFYGWLAVSRYDNGFLRNRSCQQPRYLLFFFSLNFCRVYCLPTLHVVGLNIT